MVPRPRSAQPQADAVPGSRDGNGAAGTGIPSPPHLAGTDELGPAGSQPDWWRTDAGPLGGMDIAPGFTGGVEIPEILRPPAPDGRTTDSTPGATGGTGSKDPAAGDKDAAPPKDTKGAATAGGTGTPAPTRPAQRLLRLLRLVGLLRRRPPAAPADAAPAAGQPKARRALANPLLLLAAALLVAGALLGSWFALALGWIIAYGSQRLTDAEKKWGVLGIPGLAVTAGIVWLWGRQNGRWDHPVAKGHLTDALAQAWPWLEHGAAFATAAFLVWRSQRRR
jgi:hypothetical protein